MPVPATTRLGIPQYEDKENASFSSQVNAVAEKVDERAMRFDSGTLAARPTAGIKGRYYLATDGVLSGCAEGDLYLDTGTAWVGPRNVAATIPLGGLLDYMFATDPVDVDGATRFMVANGRAISRTTYAALFKKVQAEGLLEVWGAGNGSTTFNIPNMPGRTAVHPGASGVTLGKTGGEEKHTLAVGEMPSHKHGITDPGHVHPLHVGQGAPASARGSDNNWPSLPFTPASFGAETPTQFDTDVDTEAAATGVSVNSEGKSEGHNNMQPWLGLYKIVRVL